MNSYKRLFTKLFNKNSKPKICGEVHYMGPSEDRCEISYLLGIDCHADSTIIYYATDKHGNCYETGMYNVDFRFGSIMPMLNPNLIDSLTLIKEEILNDR